MNDNSRLTPLTPSPPSRARNLDAEADCPSVEFSTSTNCDLESVDDDEFDWEGAINARYGKEEDEVKVVSKTKSKAKRRGNVLGPDEKPVRASQLTIEQKIRIFQENRRLRKWSPAPKMFTIQEVDWSSESDDDSEEEVVEPARKKRDSSPRPVSAVPSLSPIVDHNKAPSTNTRSANVARPASLSVPLSPSSSAAPSPSSSHAAPLSPSSSYGFYSPSSTSAPLSPSSAPHSPSSVSCPPSPSSVSAPVSPTSVSPTSASFSESNRAKAPPPPPLKLPVPVASEKVDSSLTLRASSSSKSPTRMGLTEEIPQTLSEESAVLATLRDLILQKQKALGVAPVTDPPTDSDVLSLQNSPILDKLAALQLIMRKRTREQEEEHKHYSC